MDCAVCAEVCPRCFNPRPPLQAGASVNTMVRHQSRDVSILARLYRRALRAHRHIPQQPGQSVSILARLYRRALRPAAAEAAAGRRPVSILARLYRRALREEWAHIRSDRESFNPRPPLQAGASSGARPGTRVPGRFNPRPPLQAGASVRDGQTANIDFLFQSSPAFTGGRFPGVLRREWVPASVSILARLYRRALRSVLSAARKTLGSFNPRPPLQAGASKGVSPTGLNEKRFNPRPPLQAGASARDADRPGSASCFNPRPPLQAGASLTIPTLRSSDHRFNPRPPLQAGASSVIRAGASPRTRFNPRPPLQAGASLQTVLGKHLQKMFQSSPAFTGGRFRCCSRCVSAAKSFQSSPAFTGGRFGNCPTCEVGWGFFLACANAVWAGRCPAHTARSKRENPCGFGRLESTRTSRVSSPRCRFALTRAAGRRSRSTG